MKELTLCARCSRSFASVAALCAIAVVLPACSHVQPLDTKRLDAAGIDYDAIKQLEGLNITAPEVPEIAKARQAGLSDAGCVQIVQIFHGRGKAFDGGDAVAALLKVRLTENSVIEIARLDQLGLGYGELQVIRLAGLSDATVLEVARHHAAGKPELSGASLAGLKNTGLRDSTIYELARRGVPDSQYSSIVAMRHRGVKDQEILRKFTGS
jgi:hypothetical protein